MSAQDQMTERVQAAKAERDRLISEANDAIKSAHQRFASFLNIEVGRVALDEEKGKVIRTNKGDDIAEAAGFNRTYLYQYMQRFKV